MGSVIDFAGKKYDMMAREAFGPLMKRFGYTITGGTHISDLDDTVVAFFLPVSPGIFHVIMKIVSKILFFRSADSYSLLDEAPEKRTEVLSVALFIVDQIRFEAMYRLGWVLDFPTRHIPLVQLIADFYDEYHSFEKFTPSLSPLHPLYPEYEQTPTPDRASIVRKLIPELIQAFHNTTSPDS